VVEAPDVVRVRELDHVLRPLDVRALRGLLVRLHVVHGRQVKQVIDLLVEPLDPEPRLRDVPRDRDDSSVLGAEPLHQRVELPARAVAHERVDGALALEQLGHEMPADETRGAGDEVVQGSSRDVELRSLC
jgi:hypothetical protein